MATVARVIVLAAVLGLVAWGRCPTRSDRRHGGTAGQRREQHPRDARAAARPGRGPTGRLLALLVGVNVGPNLTDTGSLATLLWRRVVRAEDLEPSRRAFFRLAVVSTPLALVLSTVALWLTLRVIA